MDTSTRMLIAALAVIGTALLISTATARADPFETLRNDPEVQNGVLIVAIGDLIQDNCPNFEDRRARSIPFLMRLVNRAQSLGYSRADVEAYVDNQAEKDRVEARARQWMIQQGADLDTPASICAVARSEISGQTPVGRLIRER